jgi:hypothetical protein
MTNERSFEKLRDQFRITAAMTNRHRSRARPSTVSCERFYQEWFAQRTWEDDGGRVGANIASVNG